MDTDWAAEMSMAHRAERERWAQSEAEHLAARARLAERIGRLESDLEHAMRGAVAAGAQICSLRCLVAELEAELDAAGCDDCGRDRADCEVG